MIARPFFATAAVLCVVPLALVQWAGPPRLPMFVHLDGGTSGWTARSDWLAFGQGLLAVVGGPALLLALLVQRFPIPMSTYIPYRSYWTADETRKRQVRPLLAVGGWVAGGLALLLVAAWVWLAFAAATLGVADLGPTPLVLLGIVGMALTALSAYAHLVRYRPPEKA